MDPAFWRDKWQKKEIGFHQEAINPLLLAHWGTLDVQAGAKILVPLCGKSKDMLWLAEQGFQVMGVELSEIALQEFYAESNLPYQRVEVEGVICYQGELIKLYCCDFFQAPSELFVDVAAVYDRAALVALPQELRRAYVNTLTQVLSMGTPLLLIALEFDALGFNSPPFCVDEREVIELFETGFAIKMLDAYAEQLKGVDVRNRAYRLVRI